MSRSERNMKHLHGDERESLISQRRNMINSGTVDHQSNNQGSGTGNVATFFNFAKASVGSGSFALPWGILQAGVLFGAAGMILLGIASVYTMQLMLEIKRHIQRKLPQENKDLNYTKMGKIALGTFGKWAVNISVLACNLGVCSGYMIFISSNLQWVFNCLSVRAHHFVCFDTWEIYAILLPILILLTFLPSYKYLAYAAYVGSIFLVVAMIVVYAYGGQSIFCATKDIGGNLRLLPPSWYGVAQWFGVTAFLFCVHSMVIPLESAMRRPDDMPKVLDMAALVVVGINLPFAIYGYLLFGANTQGYVFDNLPGSWFNTIVRLFLSIELTLTFPIVIKPAIDVMEEIWKNLLMFLSDRFNLRVIHELYTNPRTSYRISRIAMIFGLRIFLVLVSWSVAVGIPRFELCLALVGSFSTTVLAFILPPLFHLKLLWKLTSLFKKVFHIVILVLGVIVTIGATTINLYMAIEGGGGSEECKVFNETCARPFFDEYEPCYGTI